MTSSHGCPLLPRHPAHSLPRLSGAETHPPPLQSQPRSCLPFLAVPTLQPRLEIISTQLHRWALWSLQFEPWRPSEAQETAPAAEEPHQRATEEGEHTTISSSLSRHPVLLIALPPLITTRLLPCWTNTKGRSSSTTTPPLCLISKSTIPMEPETTKRILCNWSMSWDLELSLFPISAAFL